MNQQTQSFFLAFIALALIFLILQSKKEPTTEQVYFPGYRFPWRHPRHLYGRGPRRQPYGRYHGRHYY